MKHDTSVIQADARNCRSSEVATPHAANNNKQVVVEPLSTTSNLAASYLLYYIIYKQSYHLDMLE